MITVGLLWKVCGAPAGGCGAGRRRAVLTAEDHCATCGSEMRVAKRQPFAPGLDVWSDYARWRGLCYEVAAKYLIDVDRDIVLVHGWPILRGTSEHAGKLYGHAWLESVDGEVVFDLTVPGGRRGLPAIVYYALGNIDRRYVVRYRFTEAAREMVRTGHYGPWVEEPEGAV